MMIFRKGELVEVTGSTHPSTEKYIGKIGKVERINDLDKDPAPFLVKFYADGEKDSCTFSHNELRLVDGAEDAQQRQRYYNAARLHRMQRKV